jgi:putative membrane protein
MVPADYTMTYLILRIMINALAIAVAVKVVDGIVFSGEWWKMIFVGAVFGIVNSFLKPLLTFFTLPLIILSLGLFTLIVNTLMLLITVSLSGPLNLGLKIHGFWPAFKGALIISIMSMVLSWLTGMKKIKYYRSR